MKRCKDCNGWGSYNDVLVKAGPDKKYPFANSTILSVKYAVPCKTCKGTGLPNNQNLRK